MMVYGLSYLTSPRQVIIIKSALIQRNEQVSAGVAVGERDAGGGHFFSGRFCIENVGLQLPSERYGCIVSLAHWSHGEGEGNSRILGPPSPSPTASLIWSVTAIFVLHSTCECVRTLDGCSLGLEAGIVGLGLSCGCSDLSLMQEPINSSSLC